MSEQFSNQAQTTLNGAITSTATSLIVASATGFPTNAEFRLILKAEGANTDEIVTVTAVSGTTYTIRRASEPVSGVQVASAHGSGAVVAQVLTKGAVELINSRNPLGPHVHLYSSDDTWVKPPYLHYIEVEVQGGGASGGGTASTIGGQAAESAGGGGGGYVKKTFYAAELPSSCSIVVGQTASPPAAGNSTGTTGNNSTFSGTGITTMTGSGGTGGAGMASTTSSISAGGAGGAAAGGDINLQGGDGQNGAVRSSLPMHTSHGGVAYLSSFQRTSANLAGNAGLNGRIYGQGGSGAISYPSASARQGGSGAQGVVIITEYYYLVPPVQAYAQAQILIV